MSSTLYTGLGGADSTGSHYSEVFDSYGKSIDAVEFWLISFGSSETAEVQIRAIENDNDSEFGSPDVLVDLNTTYTDVQAGKITRVKVNTAERKRYYRATYHVDTAAAVGFWTWQQGGVLQSAPSDPDFVV